MSLLHLPTIAVPPEICRVDGCSCGGIDWHQQDCTVFTMPSERAQQAIAAAHQRMQDHSAELTRQLHAELAALRGTGPVRPNEEPT